MLKYLKGSLAGLALLSSLAFAAEIDVKNSHLKATFTQFNVPVTGEFKQFSGTVELDPSKLGQTKARLEVATDSYDLGDEQYNREVAGDDWFNSANYPQATFELKSVEKQGDNYQVTGEFTLRGVSKLIEFPANLKTDATGFVISGEAEIKRLDYGVGQGDWGDTALVEDEVQIDFKLTVPRK
ncbi:MAG: YceI family protein [Limnobacter sp.]|nr:YceI family protein [Limnobacter sp.]